MRSEAQLGAAWAGRGQLDGFRKAFPSKGSEVEPKRLTEGGVRRLGFWGPRLGVFDRRGGKAGAPWQWVFAVVGRGRHRWGPGGLENLGLKPLNLC